MSRGNLNNEQKNKNKMQGCWFITSWIIKSIAGQSKKTNKEKSRKIEKTYTQTRIQFFFDVWQNNGINWILDGTQRDKALKSLQRDGYEIPLLPVDYIEAKNKQEAREKLLSRSSQFGEWNIIELEEWTNNIDKEIEEQLRFMEKEIKTQVNIDFDDIKYNNEDEDNGEIVNCPKCGFKWKNQK